MDATKYAGAKPFLSSKLFNELGITSLKGIIQDVRETTVKDKGIDKPQLVLDIQTKDELYSLGMNVTRTQQAIDKYQTSDTEVWLGQEIEVFLDKTDFGNKEVDCLRIR